jgi:hypothetical protein
VAERTAARPSTIETTRISVMSDTDFASDTDARGARKFAEFVEVRARGKRFIARDEEMALLEAGIRSFNLSLAEAKGVLHAVADTTGAPLARDVERNVASWLKLTGGRQRRISRKQFREAVALYAEQAKDAMPAAETERRVKALMEAEGLDARRAGFFQTRRWFQRI